MTLVLWRLFPWGTGGVCKVHLVSGQDEDEDEAEEEEEEEGEDDDEDEEDQLLKAKEETEEEKEEEGWLTYWCWLINGLKFNAK